MSKTSRFAGVLVGVVLVSAGCDKSSTTPPPGKPQDETYGKKLVGVWEGTPEGPEAALGPFTVEFRADNGFKLSMGPANDRLEMPGTWKLVKEEGKTVTVDAEFSPPGGDPKGPKKTEKMTYSIEFQDANSIVMSKVGGKPDPVKMTRKS
jgi:hypothetical protein